MRQIVLRQGGMEIAEVAAPAIEPGRLLVKVEHSCVSVGTEMTGVRTASQPAWRRALADPTLLRKALDRALDRGFGDTRDLIDRKLKALHPIGYSASGVVIGAGEGTAPFRPGERVACAGNGWASHAEYVSVPVNLAVQVPDPVALPDAASVTLGAIALQGVRRLDPTLGETILVVGLGILGQITLRLLRANGVRGIGVDPIAARREMARDAGAFAVIDPTAEDVDGLVARLTQGQGADGVIITAASAAPGILSTAFRACRRKGRVVLVGDVPLDIDRADIYAKELDFLVSTSYGPGRYDSRFEEEGLDYPLAYVRWTETRNMAAYLQLVGDGAILVGDLLRERCAFDDAPAAYARLAAGGANAPLTIVLDYGPAEGIDPAALRRSIGPAAPFRVEARAGGPVRMAVQGPGGFASGTLLPIMRRHPDAFTLACVVARQGVNAASIARQFGIARHGTDMAEILTDPGIDAVLIATRHDQHASQALAALTAGKHVFVEKPLALTEDDVAAIEAFYAATSAASPMLMVGFNRRFAPGIQALQTVLADRKGPIMLSYRVNAGYIPPDHWVHGPQGGGRNLGEACHFYDLFQFLIGAEVDTVQAMPIGGSNAAHRPDDNFQATIRYRDGSVASLTYTALGDPRHPKERMELYCDARVHQLDDFKSVSSSDGRTLWQAKSADKGHEAELLAFAKTVRQGGEWPIPLAEMISATRVALDVERQIRGQG